MEFMIAAKQEFSRIELTEVVGFPNENNYLGGFDVKGKVVIITLKMLNYGFP